jgi:hypothetical protein
MRVLGVSGGKKKFIFIFILINCCILTVSCSNVSRIVVLPCPMSVSMLLRCVLYFFFFFDNVETFLKKSPLDSPLASSKTYGQLTPPARTSCRVIQCFILLIIGNVYFQSIFVSYDKREF